MNKILLDTDIYSEVLKGVNPVVARRAATYRRTRGVLTFSVVTLMEIVRGFQRARSDRRLQTFLTIAAQDEILPFDPNAAELAGRIAGDLERRGQPIGVADPMIAATAITNGMKLATGNTEHFERVRRLGHPLDLVDWRS